MSRISQIQISSSVLIILARSNALDHTGRGKRMIKCLTTSKWHWGNLLMRLLYKLATQFVINKGLNDVCHRVIAFKT